MMIPCYNTVELMTIESGLDKDKLEKTIAVNKNIRTVADCVRIPSMVSILINPGIGLASTVVASVVAEIADHRIRSNRKKMDEMKQSSPFLTSLVNPK